MKMEERLTFREKCPEVCWQKHLRDQHLNEGAPDVDLTLKNAVVRPVSKKLGRQIILKYEWLGTIGAGPQRYYGIFFGPHCAGAAVMASAGAIPAFMKTFKLNARELAYLVRGACVHWAPKGTNSKLISYVAKFERKLGYKAVIALADTDAGEIGTIYQACGWVYFGQGEKWIQWISPQGKILSYNALTIRRKNYHTTTPKLQEMLKAEGWKKQWSNPKHRYICVLDKKDENLTAVVEALRQPYPKRKSNGGAA
jgi:hypothetical protein